MEEVEQYIWFVYSSVTCVSVRWLGSCIHQGNTLLFTLVQCVPSSASPVQVPRIELSS